MEIEEVAVFMMAKKKIYLLEHKTKIVIQNKAKRARWRMKKREKRRTGRAQEVWPEPHRPALPGPDSTPVKSCP